MTIETLCFCLVGLWVFGAIMSLALCRVAGNMDRLMGLK
jgi:hypothetical protein